MIKYKYFIIFLLILPMIAFARIHPLKTLFLKESTSKREVLKIKEETLKAGKKAVPVLIEVMKRNQYPDKNRWMATFLLGKIAGVKSAPFIAKFTNHPHWIMRMASLKTLQALKQKKYGLLYANSLEDKSLLVRIQALENIKNLQLTKYAPQVWNMLFDKRNYYQVKIKGKETKKRTDIIKNIIKAVGHLKFKKAKNHLLKMAKKERYNDIFKEIDFSLEKITGKKSPHGDTKKKRLYWKRMEKLI